MKVIAALTHNGGIGYRGSIPWNLVEDMVRFRNITTLTSDSAKQNAVIMGRVTYESIDPRYRPLPNRLNIVVSSMIDTSAEGVIYAHSLNEALGLCSRLKNIETIYCIGGSRLYDEAMRHPQCSELQLTHIHNFNGRLDTYIDIPTNYVKIWESEERYDEASKLKYTFANYRKSDVAGVLHQSIDESLAATVSKLEI